MCALFSVRPVPVSAVCCRVFVCVCVCHCFSVISVLGDFFVHLSHLTLSLSLCGPLAHRCCMPIYMNIICTIFSSSLLPARTRAYRHCQKPPLSRSRCCAKQHTVFTFRVRKLLSSVTHSRKETTHRIAHKHTHTHTL